MIRADELVVESVGLHLGRGDDGVETRRDVDLSANRPGDRRFAACSRTSRSLASGVRASTPMACRSLAADALLAHENVGDVLHVELVVLVSSEEILRLAEELLRSPRSSCRIGSSSHLRVSSHAYLTANECRRRLPAKSSREGEGELPDRFPDHVHGGVEEEKAEQLPQAASRDPLAEEGTELCSNDGSDDEGKRELEVDASPGRSAWPRRMPRTGP